MQVTFCVKNIDKKSLETIGQASLFESDIAMNSMVFVLDGLGEMLEKFNRELHFAGMYRAFSIK